MKKSENNKDLDAKVQFTTTPDTAQSAKVCSFFICPHFYFDFYFDFYFNFYFDFFIDVYSQVFSSSTLSSTGNSPSFLNPILHVFSGSTGLASALFVYPSLHAVDEDSADDPISPGAVGKSCSLGLVLPMIRSLCDTKRGLLCWCPVTYWTDARVETDVVVFSVCATLWVLLKWAPMLKEENVEDYLQNGVVSDDVRINDTSPTEFEAIMAKTPYRKFYTEEKNKSHYIIVGKADWLELMGSCGTDVLDIPDNVFAMDAVKNMMVQNSSTIPADTDNFARCPSAPAVHLGNRQLTLEERKVHPPWQFTWWEELFGDGMAKYFGINMDNGFSHVDHGVYSENKAVEVVPFSAIMEEAQRLLVPRP